MSGFKSLQLPCCRLKSRLHLGQAVLATNIYFKRYLYNFLVAVEYLGSNLDRQCKPQTLFNKIILGHWRERVNSILWYWLEIDHITKLVVTSCDRGIPIKLRSLLGRLVLWPVVDAERGIKISICIYMLIFRNKIYPNLL